MVIVQTSLSLTLHQMAMEMPRCIVMFLGIKTLQQIIAFSFEMLEDFYFFILVVDV